MNRSLTSSPRYQRLKPLIELAQSEGWQVSYTTRGRLTFTKPGLPRIYNGTAFNEYRSARHVQVLTRRIDSIADKGNHHG